jgi:hypothetical protein
MSYFSAGAPRALAGPLAGCGAAHLGDAYASPAYLLHLPPEVAQEKSYPSFVIKMEKNFHEKSLVYSKKRPQTNF